MKLSDFFEPKMIARDGAFSKTMYPGTSEPESICYAAKQTYLEIAMGNENVSAIITTAQLSSLVDNTRGLVVSENPQLEYYRLHNHLVKSKLMQVHTEHAIHPTAQIATTAIVGDHVIIGKDVVIGHNSFVGDYTIIDEGTSIGEYVVIGTRGMLNTRVDDQNFPVLWAGGVKIGKRCEILTGAIIQRTYHAEYTEIADDCKISVKVVVAHGVRIGRGTMIAGSAQLAGNVIVGEDVIIGPAAVIADGVHIGDHANVKLGSSVVEDVKPNQKVSGFFAFDHTQQLRIFTRMKNGLL